MLKSTISLILLLVLAPTMALVAQTFESAGAYMEYINVEYKKISKDYWDYTSAVGHGKSARKVEGRRKELLTTVSDVTKKVSAMPAFKGDKSYRDSVVAFLKISYHVLNFDYGKIVNMEEISEQSYDAMEAYLLAQDVANDKIKAASARLDETQRAFASKNNVQIVDNNSELNKKN